MGEIRNHKCRTCKRPLPCTIEDGYCDNHGSNNCDSCLRKKVEEQMQLLEKGGE